VTGRAADAYDEAAEAWSEAPARIYRRLAEVALTHAVAPIRGRTVLDVGSGTGVASDAILAAGGRPIASDLSLGMLRHHRSTRPPAVQADATVLPFADRSVGGAMASFVLNHLDEPARALRELSRVTRRGSAIVATTYAHDDDHPVKAAVNQALTEDGWEPEPWYAHVRSVTVPQVATIDGCRSALADAGLCGTVIAQRVAFTDLAPDDLVSWRLGMAHHATHLRAGGPAATARVRERALTLLGGDPPPLERSILVLSATP
jgi:ubiquinone/menaquinone biosynthesis C-methylase UbiE